MLGILGFKLDLFTRDFWGTGGDLGSTMDQVKNMMLLVTVWVFIGIEGAAVYSGRAKHRRDIGRATVGGFFIVLALMVLVIMLCAEIVQVAGADGTMPAALGRLNAHDSPANAMWLTSICMQVVLLGTGLLGGDVYLKLILVATSMILIPHLLSAMFGASVALRAGGAGRFRVAMPSLVATVYSVWLGVPPSCAINACFAGPDVPITRRPSSTANCSAASPTPPLAPSMTRVWPARKPRARKPRSAVSAANPAAPACSHERFFGLGANAARTASSATAGWFPVLPNTSSPTWTSVTPSPTAVTTPAASWPVPAGNATMAGMNPMRSFQSKGLTPDALTGIRTWPGPGCGHSTSATVSTSGPPNAV